MTFSVQNLLTAGVLFITLVSLWVSMHVQIAEVRTNQKARAELDDERHTENKVRLEKIEDRLTNLENRR